jgi:hypothetical protein
VYVETAKSEAAFTDVEGERLLYSVLNGIAQIKSRKNCKRSLNAIRAVIERKGTSPGPERVDDWKIEMLRKLAAGELWKQVITSSAKKARSAEVELVRFCREVYEECLLFDSDSFTPHPYLLDKLQFRFGGFQFPADIAAVKEAYRRITRLLDAIDKSSVIPRNKSSADN